MKPEGARRRRDSSERRRKRAQAREGETDSWWSPQGETLPPCKGLTMWSPEYSSLLFVLILELSPQSGVSQGAQLFKYCQDCKKIVKETDVSQRFFQNLIRNADYTPCPSNIVRFKVPKGIFCGNRLDPWVDKVTNCINQGRISCLEPSETQKDFSKDSNKKPPATTQRSTTSTAQTDPSLRLSTQTWKGGTMKPSETTTQQLGPTQRVLETTKGLPTRSPDQYQNHDLLHGIEPPTEEDDIKGKMKEMTIAIISLILIVLVMAAVGVTVWCRRAKFSACKSHCTEDTIHYQPAPVQDL